MSKTLRNILAVLGKIRETPLPRTRSFKHLLFLLKNMENLDNARRVYCRDETGRNIFDWVCQHRLLGEFYSPPVPDILDNTPYPRHVWQTLTDAAMAMKPIVAGDYPLDRIDTWILEAYSLHGLCEVEPDDIVLDCGTFTGNTSVYFSKKTGKTGHVYGFEPAPVVFEAYRENVRPYANITPVNAALTDRKKASGTNPTMEFASFGPGSRLSEKGGTRVPVIAIDTFCKTRGLERIDFIKMDIEGAEAEALLGAVDTIRAHRPKMALSAYHKAADIFELPMIVEAIDPGYKFTLRHYSNEACETVLFCRHSDDPHYFGTAPEESELPVETSKLLARLPSLLEPYLYPEGLAEVSRLISSVSTCATAP